jgi:hypothetical protein
LENALAVLEILAFDEVAESFMLNASVPDVTTSKAAAVIASLNFIFPFNGSLMVLH